MPTLTSSEFKQDLTQAKRLATTAPVFITERAKPSYVLLNIADYEKLTAKPVPPPRERSPDEPSILDLLACPESVDFDFKPRRSKKVYPPMEFD